MIPLLLLTIPNVVLFAINKDYNIFLLSLLFIFLFFAAVKNSKYLIILYPFYILIPIVAYYIQTYGFSLNEQTLGIIFETNSQEAVQFLGAKLYFYIFGCILWAILVTLILYKNKKKPLIWQGRTRWLVLIVGTLYISFLFGINQLVTLEIKELNKDESQVDEEENSFLADVKQTYPFGMFLSIYDFYRQQNKINTAFERKSNFKFYTKHINDNPNCKQIIVLVIGETSRRHNWELNGYSRKTTPLLKLQPNLINFSDMISTSSATRSSVPMIITRKPVEQVFNYDFPEKSIISAFKEAGFATYWISTQQKIGIFDTSNSIYIREADHQIFLNNTNYTNKGEPDGVVLPIFKQITNSNSKKVFIVVHTLGSHYNYSHRYPKNFDVFKPSLNDIQDYSLQDVKHKTELVNSYDNSILYTDYVLNQLIETLKSQKQAESFLLFSSDHGEDLFDDGCDKSGHGNDTIYDFGVASFSWYSDKYRENNQEKVALLIKNKDQKINHTSFFPTLLDAASLEIPNYTTSRSLLKTFQSYPRLINSEIDYDKKPPQGICKRILK